MAAPLSAREAARLLQALRRRRTVACQQCGAVMTRTQGARYCSDRCRSRAYRERKAAGA